MSKKQQDFLFDKINIIGLGLIGSSLALSIKNSRICHKIFGYDNSKKINEKALSKNIIDGIFDFNFNNKETTLTIISAPLSKYDKIFSKISQNFISGNLVIDIGSVKSPWTILAQKKSKILAQNFIPCHPIAGSEKHGIDHADANLFKDRKVVICPNNKDDNLKIVKKLWQRIGCKTEDIPAKEHDEIYALISHMPQLLAFISKEKALIRSNQMSSFLEPIKQHLRIENSNPKLWQEIFTFNQENLHKLLGEIVIYIDSTIKDLTNDNIDQIFSKILQTSIYEKHSLNLNADFEKLSQKQKLLLSKRLLLLNCFLNLNNISNFEKYGGSGFNDFCQILCYLAPSKKNKFFWQQNKSELILFLQTLRLKIINNQYV